MNSSKVFIGLGSNMGNSPDHLDWAVKKLESVLQGVTVSTYYSTVPRDYTNQPDFVNACACGFPRISPEDLLTALLSWEQERGRFRDPSLPKGPRPLDLDILLWGKKKISIPILEVPHPRITDREFVIIPLLELDPFLVHPVTGIPFAESLKALEPQGIYYQRILRV